MYQDLLELLTALDGVQQDPRWHPEGCALYHSLQAFALARQDTSDRALWAAALLHDVGKAVSSPDHDEVGADLLDGIVAPRVVWLVRHHLDLLRNPGQTKRRLRGAASRLGSASAGEAALVDLQRLRRWDVGGRSPHASVIGPEEALAILLDGDTTTLDPSGEAAPLYAPRKEDQ